MGISLYLIWNKGVKIKIPLIIFGAQLLLNIVWSLLFFGLHSPFYGFIKIIVLWISIAFTIFSFLKISKEAGLLLLPYIFWVSFAMIMNYYVWILNPLI